MVEVSDTTLALDTKDKATLCARAGIADYWVLDVNNRRIIVHRSPSHGEYQSLTVYSGSEPVSPLRPTRAFASPISRNDQRAGHPRGGLNQQ